RTNDWVALMGRDGVTRARVGAVYVYEGLKRIQVEQADAGEIVALTGIKDANLGDTIADADEPRALPAPKIDEPTLRMTFRTNDSPFAGKEGTYVTSRHLRERLFKELERNVSLRVEETDSPDVFVVSG